MIVTSNYPLKLCVPQNDPNLLAALEARYREIQMLPGDYVEGVINQWLDD